MRARGREDVPSTKVIGSHSLRYALSRSLKTAILVSVANPSNHAWSAEWTGQGAGLRYSTSTFEVGSMAIGNWQKGSMPPQPIRCPLRRGGCGLLDAGSVSVVSRLLARFGLGGFGILRDLPISFIACRRIWDMA